MCHDILKEEDDDVPSLGDATDSGSEDKTPTDNLLDEKNGNINAKLSNLTLNENNGNPITLNGNTVDDDDDTECSSAVTKGSANKNANKKKTKKVANNNNNNNNDNKTDGSGSQSNDDVNSDILSHTSDLVNDDVAVVQG